MSILKFFDFYWCFEIGATDNILPFFKLDLIFKLKYCHLVNYLVLLSSGIISNTYQQ